MTETPYCILCPDRERIPNAPPVCDACRSWLAGMLGDLRILSEQLVDGEEPIRDERLRLLLDRKKRQPILDEHGRPILTWADPVGAITPAALIPAAPAWSRVQRVPESRPPLNLGPLDLVGPARPGSRAPAARGALGYDDDQAGWLPVATMLEAWVVDVIGARALGEHRPEPTVDAMTRWLADRVEWMCDQYPDVVDFADEVRQYRGVLRNTLGLDDRPVYKAGVACPKCDQLALYQRNGSEYIECGNCEALMSPEEYKGWTTELADDTRRVA